jgi:hypothetical protein
MHLMRKCPCPVWAIKTTNHKPFNRILAAVDTSPSEEKETSLNRKIMNLAISLAHSEGSELHIVHCWSPFIEKIQVQRSGISPGEIDRFFTKAEPQMRKRLGSSWSRFILKILFMRFTC